MLSKFFPVLELQQESIQRLYEQIICPAADLADMMHTSASNYGLRMPIVDFCSQGSVAREDINSYHLIDIDTRRTLTPNSLVTANSQGFIGNFLMPLEPDLCRLIDEHNTTELCQMTYLIKLHYPLGKRN